LRQQSKKTKFKASRISWNEAYLCTPKWTRNEAQRKNWTFYEAVTLGSFNYILWVKGRYH